MRRSGRTTKLIVKAISELLETDETHFVDHPKDNGLIDYPQHHYKQIAGQIEHVLNTLLRHEKASDAFKFDVRANGEGLKIWKKKEERIKYNFMRGKIARKLRKIAQQNTIGMTTLKTRQAYQQLKELYKVGTIK